MKGRVKQRILVTAGPTWTKIDEVKIITNIFSGWTGYYVARKFSEKGFFVTLLLGPTRFSVFPIEKVRILRFKYFDELRNLIKRELSKRRYAAVIHLAAVSDYKPVRIYSGKISSGKKQLIIKCKPTPKIIKEVRKMDKRVFLVQFKLEVNLSDEELLKRAYESMIENNADLVVANKLEDMRRGYKGFIIDREKNIFLIKSRYQLANLLIKKVKERRI